MNNHERGPSKTEGHGFDRNTLNVGGVNLNDQVNPLFETSVCDPLKEAQVEVPVVLNVNDIGLELSNALGQIAICSREAPIP